MPTRKPHDPRDPRSSEITPENLYWNRRRFIKNAALFVATAAGAGGALVTLSGGKRGNAPSLAPEPGSSPAPELDFMRSRYIVDEPMTPYQDVTTYNNFYEFG